MDKFDQENLSLQNAFEDDDYDPDQNIDLSSAPPLPPLPLAQAPSASKQRQAKVRRIATNSTEDLIPMEREKEEPEAETIFLQSESLSYEKPTVNEDGDPPLMEDIGIDPSLIIQKMVSIALVNQPQQAYIEEPDMTGPALIAFLLGLELMASGKLEFGDIYATFVVGNIFSFVLFNLMSQRQPISLYSIMSILGYGLLPMLSLGLLSIFFSLKGQFGILAGIVVAIWSAMAASNYLEAMIGDYNRKALVVYPLSLFYISFVMITIF